MAKKNLDRKLVCPMCKQRWVWGDMLKHVAYSTEPEHEQWRTKHGFPAIIPFGTLKDYEPNLRIVVATEFGQ